LIVFLAGCATTAPEQAEPAPIEPPRQITNISMNETAESVVVTIEGDSELEYTAFKRGDPRGVRFIFPETSIAGLSGTPLTDGSDVISSIETEEIGDGTTPKSTLFIALKEEAPYDLQPTESGIRISFPKARRLVEQQAAYKVESEDLPVAKMLESITADTRPDDVYVSVVCDGSVGNYKSFTLDNPPRIVIDMYDLKSPYDATQKVSLNSKCVNRFRHFGHSDKVRLVLDTEKGFLDRYSVSPTETGLMIHVGEDSFPIPENKK
jgi:type IV pilus assembly protein PilQ